MGRFLGWLCLLLCSSSLWGQKTMKGISFVGSVHSGLFVKHNPKVLQIQTTRPVLGGELSFEQKLYGKKYWHQLANYPQWGLSLTVQDFGNSTILGQAIGLRPHLRVNIFQGSKLQLYTQLGIGLAWLNKPYSPVDNPENNAIGSHLNNNTDLRFALEYACTKHVQLYTAGHFTHYSNASSQAPNWGINTLIWSLGIRYTPNPLLREDYIKHEIESTRSKLWNPTFSFTMGGGVKESSTPGGPKLPVYLLRLDGGVFIGANNRLKLGLEYDYLTTVYAFRNNHPAYREDNDVWKSSRMAIYIGDEVLLGRWGLEGNIGFYFTQSGAEKFFMPFHLHLRHYFMDPLHSKIQAYVGLSMKTHLFTADYFTLNLGLAF